MKPTLVNRTKVRVEAGAEVDTGLPGYSGIYIVKSGYSGETDLLMIGYVSETVLKGAYYSTDPNSDSRYCLYEKNGKIYAKTGITTTFNIMQLVPDLGI